MTVVMFILFSHYIGDCIFQTGKMADNKHHNILQLFYHVAVYSFVIFGMLILGNYFNFAGQLDLIDIVKYTLLNFVLHFVTDFFTLKQVNKLWLDDKIYTTSVIVSLNQFIHIFSLFATLNILF